MFIIHLKKNYFTVNLKKWFSDTTFLCPTVVLRFISETHFFSYSGYKPYKFLLGLFTGGVEIQAKAFINNYSTSKQFHMFVYTV